MTILDFIKNVKLEFNLVELILVMVIGIVIRKLALALKNERKIDERLRETKARISNVVKEIEQRNDGISSEVLEVINRKTTLAQTQTKTPNKDELTTEYVMETLALAMTEDSKDVPKGKKTRAMSMEKRWADYDRKRSMRNTA